MPSTTNPLLDAGMLDRRVTLLQPIYNQWEDEITDWRAVSDVWAAVQPVFGQEMNVSERTVMSVMTTIVIRYRSGIDARWRVQDKEKLYEIIGILDVARRHVQLQLNCTEVA
jgi:SPP1 family predicted phage head-tail adaptor